MHLIIISVSHRTLLHHWYVLSQPTGSQAQFVKSKKIKIKGKSVIFQFLLKNLCNVSPLILNFTILFNFS